MAQQRSAATSYTPLCEEPVKTKEPATEGFVAMLEPFIDTVVVCTMTALTIVITGAYTNKEASELGGVALTSSAFETVIPNFSIILAFAVVLFAFSTMLSWSYYGMKAVGYLFGDSRTAERVYQGIFLVFTVIGSAAALGPVINFSDSMIFLMGVPNIVGLYLLAPVIRREVHGYFSRVKSGEVKQVKTPALTG